MKYNFGNKVKKNIRELSIVFIGVFTAFFLNDYQNRQVEVTKERELYKAVYEDLQRFYEAGIRENPEGFINMLEVAKNQLDSIGSRGEILPSMYLYADFWQTEIINSLMLSGKMNELDINVFKRISRFYTMHENFLKLVSDLNRYYENELIANDDTAQLKQKYLRLNAYMVVIIISAESCVLESKRIIDWMTKNEYVD